jgi:hypothetical protein
MGLPGLPKINTQVYHVSTIQNLDVETYHIYIEEAQAPQPDRTEVNSLHINDVSLYVVDCDSRISHMVLLILQHGPQGSHCRVHKHSFFAVGTWFPRVFLT